jgi:hypothetical protein
VTMAAAVILLVALTVARGPLDPRYQVLGEPFGFRGQGGVLLVVNQLALAATTLAVVVGAASLVVRFRRARGAERQQLRWVASAAALALLGAVVGLGGLAVGATAVVTWAISACFAVLPLAIGRPSSATGSMTWTTSSAAPWATGCSRCCWAAGTPPWS